MKKVKLMFLCLLMAGGYARSQCIDSIIVDGKTGMQIVKEYKRWSALKNDWPQLLNYQEDNQRIMNSGANPKVVFMGNSITEMWSLRSSFLEDNAYVNRGISGQTTPQMLLRFRQDVVALNPEVVVILAGTNDIAGNTGPTTNQMILDNIASMTDIAKQHGIQVILCSVLPVFRYPWASGIDVPPIIEELNTMIRAYADRTGAAYVDYYRHMVDARKGLPESYAADGVHPTPEGYAVMEPLVQQAIEKIVTSK